MSILSLPAARMGWRLRFAGWFLLTLAANWFWLWITPHLADGYHNQLGGFGRFFGVPLLIGLLLGWVLGLLGRDASWLQRVAIAVIGAAMPLLIVFCMLVFGCAIWNGMAGGYRCGL